MTQKSQVERFINCYRCWTESTCQVELCYNENGRVVDARVLSLPVGWEYEELGEGKGSIPLCPVCR